MFFPVAVCIANIKPLSFQLQTVQTTITLETVLESCNSCFRNTLYTFIFSSLYVEQWLHLTLNEIHVLSICKWLKHILLFSH